MVGIKLIDGNLSGEISATECVPPEMRNPASTTGFQTAHLYQLERAWTERKNACEVF